MIYVPTKRPEADEQMQADPFALCAECGAVFPQDDGDEYLSLCLRARPDHATEIRQVLATSPSGPTFAVIDAIGGGVSWPKVRATLRVESGREILAALLAPSASQSESLGVVRSRRERSDSAQVPGIEGGYLPSMMQTTGVKLPARGVNA